MNSRLIDYLENEINTIEFNVKAMLEKKKKVVKAPSNRKKIKRGIPFIYPDEEDKSYTSNQIELLSNGDKYREYLELERSKNLKINEENFFAPLQKSLKLTLDAVNVSDGDPQQSLELFWEAVDVFPRNLNLDLLFNLAKSQVENGEYSEGIFHFYLYIKNSYIKDPLRKSLIQYLSLDNDLTTGKLEGKRFTIEDEEVLIEDMIDELINVKVPFPYRVPIDLQIQDMGKSPDKLVMEEYKFLVQVVDESSDNKYKIKIPREHLIHFTSSFLPVLQEEDLFFNYLIDFEILHFENHLIKLKEDLMSASLKADEANDKLNELVPILQVTVPNEKKDLFIIEFSQFIERFILPQKNILELVQENTEKFKQHLELQKSEAEYENLVSISVDFQEYIEPHVKYYAELHTLLFNFRHNIEDPYVTKQPITYYEAFNRYLSFYGDKYEFFKIPQEMINKMKKRITEVERKQKLIDERKKLLNKIIDQKVKKKIEDRWDYIEEKIGTDLDSALISMRKCLEVLTEAHLIMIGLTEHTEKSLAERMKYCEKVIPSSIWKDMFDIKDSANQAAHDHIKTFSFIENKKPQPKVIYGKFENVIRYYINNIGL